MFCMVLPNFNAVEGQLAMNRNEQKMKHAKNLFKCKKSDYFLRIFSEKQI